MTQEEKTRKIKLIRLILLVETEYARRSPFKTEAETIAFAMEVIWWAMELKNVMGIIPFEPGSASYVENAAGRRFRVR